MHTHTHTHAKCTCTHTNMHACTCAHTHTKWSLWQECARLKENVAATNHFHYIAFKRSIIKSKEILCIWYINKKTHKTFTHPPPNPTTKKKHQKTNKTHTHTNKQKQPCNNHCPSRDHHIYHCCCFYIPVTIPVMSLKLLASSLPLKCSPVK
jgi:hypothetical protein